MAKRPARGARARASTRPAARRPSKRTARPSRKRSSRLIEFTPRLVENIRRRYEHSAEGAGVIARDHGVSKSVIQRLAREHKWVVYKAPPRDLSAAERLALEAEALEERSPAIDTPAPQAAAPGLPPATEAERVSREIERLIGGVSTELDIYEAMRARLKHLPQSPLDAERTARTLSALTTTLHRLQRLRAGDIESRLPDDYDDPPADIDAFRDALARRIEAFMESRTDEECGLGDEHRRGNAAPS